LPYLAAALALLLDLWASCHLVLNKRDSRAAVAWLGFIWLVPLLGPLLYVVLGINRIRRRAHLLRRRGRRRIPPPSTVPRSPDLLAGALAPDGLHLRTLARLGDGVTRLPLVGGNRVVPFTAFGQTYTAMLDAIRQARESVALSTYIFDNDRVGALFLTELRRAVVRGVAVRVLVDDVGAQYTWPSIAWPLRRLGAPFALFLPRLVPWSLRYANLRNHRKILVVDGKVGFTGGMNIREACCPTFRPPCPVDDLHFRVDGPVVAHLQQVFADDWCFSTGEALQGPTWFPSLDCAGSVLARGVPDGPDEDFEKLKSTLLGALSCARSSVRILTPYFLPDAALVTALNLAAMRGVEVDILLPARNNLRLVQWASTAQLWQVLQRGCRVWLSPPPFDHGKLMLVDGVWSLMGSSNWDPRSLRLNFEFNLECYDWELARQLELVFQSRLRKARPVSLAEVDSRSLPIRLRDGCAHLLSPYL
jgi:cardiolipin synthase